MSRSRRIFSGPARRRRWIAAVAGLAMVLAFTWSAGLIWFVGQIPRAVSDLESRTDAIVVLTGGSLRLETGFRLLSQDMAEKLFVSGVEKGVPFDDLLAVSALTPEDLECCVTLGYMADDTGSNAVESAAWIRSNQLRSIRLVTAGYHMPRSLLEFRRILPGLEIVPHPVFPDRVMIEDWWRRPGTASLIIAEFNKYLLSAARRGLWIDGEG